MAEDRTVHNAEYERVRQETEASILAWRDYLRTVYEDLSTTTTHITSTPTNTTTAATATPTTAAATAAASATAAK